MSVVTENAQKNLMDSNELRIVLVGKTGVGKSAAGNIILKKDVFKSDLSSSSVTSDCLKDKAEINGRTVAVIDTPGLFDTSMSQEKVIEKIKLCISLCAPGPHVLLVVLQLGRFTEEEQKTLEIIESIFVDSSEYTMVLFTHGDMLKYHNKTVEEYISNSEKLIRFIESTSKMYNVFDNTNKNDPQQVNMLLDQIDKLVNKNGGQHYTNETLQMAESAIREEQKRLQEEKHLDALMARETAERNNAFLKAASIGVAAAAAIVGIAAAIARGLCTIQ